jgi:hypothetical protein
LIFVSSSVLIGANPWLDVVVVRLRKPDSEISRSAAKLRLLKRLKCTLKYEKLAWATGAQLVCGVDEVGRGAFFGPVVAGAVILDPKYRIKGLRDSKLLPAARREVLSERIKEHCIAWSVAAVDAARIDQINIYQASLLAMVQAIEQLDPRPDYLLLDAVRVQFDCPQTKIIHGDALSASIAAATRSSPNGRRFSPNTTSHPTRATAAPNTSPACASSDRRRCTGSRSLRCGWQRTRRKCWSSCCRKTRKKSRA